MPNPMTSAISQPGDVRIIRKSLNLERVTFIWPYKLLSTSVKAATGPSGPDKSVAALARHVL